MTKEILKQLAKKANVNLSNIDRVQSFLNMNETFILTFFYITEVCGGEKRDFMVGSCRTSFLSVLKRDELDDDYYTNGIQWRYEIELN